MSDNNEEDQNIDDLVDYNDFDSKDLESQAEQDSFNNDILKIYEDHRKNNNSKSNEMNNAQRPISKYQRVVSTDKRENKDKDWDINHANNDNNSPIKCDNINDNLSQDEITAIIDKLNLHINRNKITINNFCDDINIFLDLSDFRELFKKIRFDISQKDYQMLFNYNNPNKEEGYLLCKNFIENSGVKFFELSIEMVNTNFDMNKLNDEFKIFNSEILDIVKKDLYETNMKRLNLRSAKIKGGGGKKLVPLPNGGGGNNLAHPTNSNNNMSNNYSTNILNLSSNTSKARPKSSSKLLIPKTNSMKNEKTNKTKLDIDQLFKENVQKKKNEDLLMKTTIEKRDKEYTKDCLKKINEANKIAAEMRLNRLYDTIRDSVCKNLTYIIFYF